MQDISGKYKTFQLKKPIALVANGTGSAVEIDAGVNDDMLATLSVGACGAGATDKLDVTVEASVDSAFTTPVTVGTFTQILGTSTGGVAAVSVKRGNYGFFRAKWVVTNGSAPTFVAGVNLLASMAQRTSSLNSATVA